MKLLANTFLLFAILLFILSCSKEGESFIGNWRHVKNPNAKIEILANGENFLVIANGKENPATYNKGNLEIRTNQLGFEILQISYIEKDDKLIVNGVFGPQEYVRMDSAIENLETEEPAFIPSEQLKINNDLVFREWREIASLYRSRAKIGLELINLSGKNSQILDDFIKVADESKESNSYYDEIAIDESLFKAYLVLQGKIGSELSKILISIEPYNNKSIREVSSRLEHTENQIAHRRIKYNSVVKKYNLLVDKEGVDFIKANSRYAKKFLTDIIASASEDIPVIEY